MTLFHLLAVFLLPIVLCPIVVYIVLPPAGSSFIASPSGIVWEGEVVVSWTVERVPYERMREEQCWYSSVAPPFG